MPEGSSHKDPDEERLIAEGLAYAEKEGGKPILVVPSRLNVVNAPALLIDDDLFTAVTTGSHLNDAQFAEATIVFPGSIDLLNAAISAGRVPQTSAVIVLVRGKWRKARRIEKGGESALPQLEKLGTLARKLGVGAVRLQPLRTILGARDIQPYIDKREKWVLPALLGRGNFPYRQTHFVDKRILLGAGSLDGGGAERQIINTIEGLRARGFDDVHLLVEHLDVGKANAFYIDKAAKVAASIVRPAERPIGPSQWLQQNPELRWVVSDFVADKILQDAQTIKRLSPEIVQCSLDWPNITIGMAGVLAGVPHVFISGRNMSPRHFAFFQWFMFPCYRALAAHSSVHFLNNSEAGRDDYARWLRLPRDKIRVLRNGLHADEFAPVTEPSRLKARTQLGLAHATPVIAGAFRLSDEKRPALWLDTAAQIKAKVPDAIFLHCGIGGLQEQVEAQARHLGLEGSVRFLGARTDVQTVFAAADLVLLTSLLEGTPNTLIEAQAMGIPVVTTPARGAAEAVEDGVTGVVVHTETAGALAQAAVKLLSDPTVSARTRQAGPAFIEARFGFKRMIDDTLAAYADAGVPWAIELLPPEQRAAVRVDFDRSQIVHDGGQAFRVRLPQFARIADGPDTACRSSLCVLEDDRPLGPAHTAHEQIRKVGGGAFSHWGEWCYFSSSDRTAVTNNGRRYSALVPRTALAAVRGS